MTASRWAAVVFAAVLIAGAGYMLTAPGEAEIVLRPDDGKTVAVGQALYTAHCAACHGTRLEGQANWRQRGPDGLLPAPPHDATGHTWHHPDEHLFRMTKFGVQKFAGPNYRSAMPAYEGKLSDAEIIAVLSYIKSRWPAQIRNRHDELNRRYAASRR